MSNLRAELKEHCKHLDLSQIDFGPLQKYLALIGLASAGLLTGCGPARVEKWEDVGPNQTAFKIEMENDKQIQFESEQYLQARKVPAKRIPIEQRKASTGRMGWNYKWIPTTIVIKVDRGLVTREWTKNEEKEEGNRNNDSLVVTTKDGTAIYFGINLTARIDEPMAAKYLYYHGQRSLGEVVDTNIRSDIQGLLSSIVGDMTRIEVQNNQPKIFLKLIPEVKRLAAERGITIETLGPAEGLQYANPAIQQSIDNQILAENAKKTAEANQAAADIENATMIKKAKANAEAAKLVASNVEALKKQQEIETAKLKGEAAVELAKRWDGKLPENIMPANSPFLNQLGFGSGGSEK